MVSSVEAKGNVNRLVEESKVIKRLLLFQFPIFMKKKVNLAYM